MYKHSTRHSRRFNIMIAATVLATLLTTGCRKDNDSKVFTAVIPNYNGAKDYIDGSMVFWSNGDAVRVNNAVFPVAVSNGDRHRATINTEGADAIGGEYFAAYPADIAGITNADHITFALPQEEAYTTDGGRQVIHSVMAAKADGQTFRFQNVCALLHFKVCSNVSGAKLRSVEVVTDKPMWGTISTEYSSSQWQVTSVTGTDNTSRTLRFDTPLALSSEAKDVYLIIPPVSNATTFTLRLTVDDGTVKVFEKNKEGSFSFSSGNLYHFDDVNTYTSSGMKFGTGDPIATVTDGSEEHPYLVYSSENWTNLASAMTTTNSHIVLANDVNVSSTLSGNFKAILDGNGHTVTLTTQNISLFSIIEGGTVKNLTIAATNDVTNPVLVVDGNRFFGALAGVAKLNASFYNCINKVNINSDINYSSSSIGGLLGKANNCTISNCTNNGNINSNSMNIGGIVGQTGSLTSFTGNINNGNITITSSSGNVYTQYCGGVVGILSLSNNDNYITDCHNNGSITLEKASTGELFIGGVIGQLPCNLKNCSNSGTIHCNFTTSQQINIGGIASVYSNFTLRNIYNSYNEGAVTCVDCSKKINIGGIICNNKKMNIYNCYVFSNLTGTNVAGIVYDGSALSSNVIISNCYYYGLITYHSSSYGIAGNSLSSNSFLIDHCYYPSEYNLCGNYSTGTGNNATLSNATTLTNGTSLATALNDNLNNNLNNNLPAGSYHWQNSTSSPAHVVFVTGSK